MSNDLSALILFIPLGLLIWGILVFSGYWYKQYGIIGLLILAVFTLAHIY